MLSKEEKEEIDRRINKNVRETNQNVPYFVHQILEEYTEEDSTSENLRNMKEKEARK